MPSRHLVSCINPSGPQAGLFSSLLLLVLGTGCSAVVVAEPEGPEPESSSSCGEPYAKAFGAPGTTATQLVLAADGCAAVVAGGVVGPLSFGGAVLPGDPDDEDAFVAKLDASGAHVWSHRFGRAGHQRVSSVAVDASGNVFVAGFAEGTLDLGNGPLAPVGIGDLFLAKFDAAGLLVWAKRFGASSVRATLTLDPSGDVVVTGVFSGDLDLQGDTLHAGASRSVFAVKFAADGARIWSRALATEAAVEGSAILESPSAIDPTGNVYLTGVFGGTLDFGVGPLVSEQIPATAFPDNDAYFAKLDRDGNVLASRILGGAGAHMYLTRVGVLDDGRAVVTGMCWGPVDFGDGQTHPSSPLGGSDSTLFLVGLDRDGDAVEWSKTFGDHGLHFPEAVAGRGAEFVLTGNSYQGSIDFGGGDLTDAEGHRGFVARFSADGTHRSSAQFGDGGTTESTSGLAFDDEGAALIGGTFNGAIDPGGAPLSSVGFSDAYVARLGR